MTGRSVVDALTAMNGVYGSFLCSLEGKNIVSAAPADFTVEVLETLSQQGASLMDQAKKKIPDCYELRLDSEAAVVLIYEVQDRLVFVFTNHPDPEAPVILRPQILEICAQYQADAQFVPTSFSAPFESAMSIVPRTRAAQLDRANPLNAEIIKPATPEEKAPTTTVEADRYTKEVKIGEGGTAEVYRAYDTHLKREVALKRFKENSSKNTKDDYRSELISASRIRHHGVVSIFDAGVDNRGRFIVMELVNGENLEKLGGKNLSDLNSFTDFAVQALEGLNTTHESGLLHLDLKPSNIMISTGASGRNHVTLIDYGQATLRAGVEGSETPVGHGLDGSIYFTSPEYLNKAPVDTRSDIYSMGCLFYWILSGKFPFDGYTSLQVMAAHLQHIVPPLQEVVPEIPSDLAEWVMSLISLEPDKRPADAQTALELLLKKVNTDKIHQLGS